MDLSKIAKMGTLPQRFREIVQRLFNSGEAARQAEQHAKRVHDALVVEANAAQKAGAINSAEHGLAIQDAATWLASAPRLALLSNNVRTVPDPAQFNFPLLAHGLGASVNRLAPAIGVGVFRPALDPAKVESTFQGFDMTRRALTGPGVMTSRHGIELAQKYAAHPRFQMPRLASSSTNLEHVLLRFREETVPPLVEQLSRMGSRLLNRPILTGTVIGIPLGVALRPEQAGARPASEPTGGSGPVDRYRSLVAAPSIVPATRFPAASESAPALALPDLTKGGAIVVPDRRLAVRPTL